MTGIMSANELIFGTFQYKEQLALQSMMEESLKVGIKSFDTAPSYKTESILGESVDNFIQSGKYSREDFFLQDKIDAWQMFKSKGRIMPYIDESLQKLKTNYIDSLLIHWPYPDYIDETWNSFREAQIIGKVKKIGICNVRKKHLEGIIKRTGIKPDIVQIERHPLRTCHDDIVFFQQLCISIQAYSPLCRMDERLLNSNVLKRIALKYNKNIGQIILRWHIQTGVSPIFMTRKKERIAENVSIFDFALSEEEVRDIERLNSNYKIFVESICCPGI